MTIEEISFENDPESHHQFLKSIEIQSQQTQLCCIVFVEQRITAYALCEWLKQAASMVPGFDFLKPEFVVGHGTFGSGGGEMSMSEKLQQKKLRSFRDGTCNVLVATQVSSDSQLILSIICNQGRVHTRFSEGIYFSSQNQKYLLRKPIPENLFEFHM